MVERIKELRPDTLAVLIASERVELMLSQGRLEVNDGIVSINSVNRGGMLKEVEHVHGGKGRYRGSALGPARAETEVKLSACERQVLSPGPGPRLSSHFV